MGDPVSTLQDVHTYQADTAFTTQQCPTILTPCDRLVPCSEVIYTTAAALRRAH